MDVDDELNKIVNAYTQVVKGVDHEAMSNTDRAYGGIIRARKGTLVEDIGKALIKIAWHLILKQDCSRLHMDKTKIDIHLKPDYVDKIDDPAVKKYLLQHMSEMVYKFSADIHVYIDDKLVLPIECKAYTENAMLKRILFDAMLMKEATNIDTYYLLQLESQLGGDYSSLNSQTLGSPTTHVLMSHADVNLKIITLLAGERKVDQPIHKANFYKPLTLDSLRHAVYSFAKDLKQYC